MTEEQIALGRRAVACKGWRWMEGMRSKSPNGMMSCRVSFYDLNRQPHMLPDLTDPATLGCLLALVREAMNDEHAGVAWDLSGEKWVCDGLHVYNGKTYLGVFAQGQSYAETLVAALEAAQEATP